MEMIDEEVALYLSSSSSTPAPKKLWSCATSRLQFGQPIRCCYIDPIRCEDRRQKDRQWSWSNVGCPRVPQRKSSWGPTSSIAPQLPVSISSIGRPDPARSLCLFLASTSLKEPWNPRLVKRWACVTGEWGISFDAPRVACGDPFQLIYILQVHQHFSEWDLI